MAIARTVARAVPWSTFLWERFAIFGSGSNVSCIVVCRGPSNPLARDREDAPQNNSDGYGPQRRPRRGGTSSPALFGCLSPLAIAKLELMSVGLRCAVCRPSRRRWRPVCASRPGSDPVPGPFAPGPCGFCKCHVSDPFSFLPTPKPAPTSTPTTPLRAGLCVNATPRLRLPPSTHSLMLKSTSLQSATPLLRLTCTFAAASGQRSGDGAGAGGGCGPLSCVQQSVPSVCRAVLRPV
jgi:hypothetical protein